MRVLLLLALALLTSCYEPTQFEQPDRNPSIDTTGNQNPVRSINTGHQICNPAISGDTVNFPAAMLWLGFSGDLTVKNPPAGYTTSKVVQHDRLNISSIDNSILWYLYMDSVPGVTCEFQDPDWSTHPSWILTMGARTENNDCANEEYIYSGWFIRPIDNARFRFNSDALDYISTPHAWIEPTITGPDSARKVDTASYDSKGLATAESIEDFFGSRQVKISWSMLESGMTIHYIDYSEAKPTDRTLAKPAGKETFKAESAMISPDGKWIAYHIYDRQDAYSSYVQELKPGSQPILLAPEASDPRWWVHPLDNSRLFLVYATQPTGISYIQKIDYTNTEALQDLKQGATWMQEIRTYSGMPADLALERVGAPHLVSSLPFRGGRSPDGHYLATGTNLGFLMELP